MKRSVSLSRTVLRTTVAVAIAAGFAPQSRAQDVDENYPAVVEVCGRCHADLAWTKTVRTWAKWNEAFTQMSKLGATGTEEQLNQVTTYFLDHLTMVNVNTGTQEEVAWVLDVSDDVAMEILAHRTAKPFKTAKELSALGVSADRLALLGKRVQF